MAAEGSTREKQGFQTVIRFASGKQIVTWNPESPLADVLIGVQHQLRYDDPDVLSVVVEFVDV